MLTDVRRNFMKNKQGDALSCKLTPNYKIFRKWETSRSRNNQKNMMR